MDRASAHGLLPNQEHCFLKLLFYYVWYSWNLFFLKGYLIGPPSHRQNANFWLILLLDFGFYSNLSSWDNWESVPLNTEEKKENIKILVDTIAFCQILSLGIVEMTLTMR